MDADQALLTEIRDLLREIRDGLAHPPALPMRARTVLALGRGKTQIRAHKLQPYAAQIVAWLDSGHTQQQVLALLAGQGVPVSDSALSRFVRTRLMIGEEGDA